MWHEKRKVCKMTMTIIGYLPNSGRTRIFATRRDVLKICLHRLLRTCPNGVYAVYAYKEI